MFLVRRPCEDINEREIDDDDSEKGGGVGVNKRELRLPLVSPLSPAADFVNSVDIEAVLVAFAVADDVFPAVAAAAAAPPPLLLPFLL